MSNSVANTKTMEEQIDQLVAQFKADLLALLSSPSKTNGPTVEPEPETNTKAEAEAKDVPTERDAAGNQIWKNAQGQIHRDGDQPAIIRHNGQKEWCQHNQLHRDDDKPAVFQDAEEDFYSGGQLVKTVIHGLQKWYQHGQLHRSNDQPAIVSADGFKAWYQHGRCHRYGKPAVVRANGEQEWWVEGKCIKKLLFKTG